MDEYELMIQRAKKLHAELADAIGNPRKVWCKQCGSEQSVDAASCLRHGWPECCGYTMTIDHPETWKRSNAD